LYRITIWRHAPGRGAPLEALDTIRRLLHYDLVMPRSKRTWAARCLRRTKFRCHRALERGCFCPARLFRRSLQLGIAQGTAGNFSSAIQELTTAVKLKPDDAGAEANSARRLPHS